MFPRKFLTAPENAFHAFNSSLFMVEINAGSFSNGRIWGPSKIPALIFSYVSLGNFEQRYLKHSPSLSKALTNCFINPNFLYRGGKSTFSLFTNGTFFRFFSPSTNTFLLGHFLFFQWSYFALLSHKHKKQGYFVLPPCCPRSMANTFKPPHITHSCSAYLILSRIVFVFSCVSFICIECSIGSEARLFPLCNRTHFRLLLELSMNSLHSDGG